MTPEDRHPPGWPPAQPPPQELGGPEVGGPPRRTNARTPLAQAAEVVPLLAGVVFFSVVGSSGDEQGSSAPLLVLVAIFAVARLGFSAVSWWFRTYQVAQSELIVDEGVLSRRRRVVPYDRIQQVDVHQSLVGQILDLGEVRVATAAGGGTDKLKLTYLAKDDAEVLRSYALERRAVLQGQEPATRPSSDGAPAAPGSQGEPTTRVATEGRTLLTLPPKRLALASLTDSQLLAGAIGGLAIGLWAGAGAAAGGSTRGQLALLLGGGLLAAFVLGIGSAVLVVVRNLTEHYRFTLSVRDDDLELRYGLFEVRTLSVPRRRVQQITVVDNPLRRALGLASLQLRTASVSGEASAFSIPLIDRAGLDALLVAIMGSDAWTPPGLVPRAAKARARGIRRRCGLIALAIAPPVIILFPLGLAVLPLVLAGIPWGRVAHDRAGHGVSGTLVGLSRGAVFHRADLVPVSRVQSCRSRASILQRRSRLTTFHLDVAGRGGARAELYDTDADTAEDLLADLPRRSHQPIRATPG